MEKKIKMLLYGGPGVGKSVFATKAPKPFFITTDGNYAWLDEFGAKPEDHKQVSTWSDFLDFVQEDSNFDNYETIVIDLLQDLFDWCEYEFVKRNKLEHIGDLGYGKGYGITRDEFFIEISKLIAKDKHIILLMHETSQVVKDRRGVESTIYRPWKELPETVLNKVEGRMRFVLRAYTRDVEVNGTFETRRYLAVSPKPNEYGIIRGVNDKLLTEDIALDWNEFTKIIQNEKPSAAQPKVTKAENKESEAVVTPDKKSAIKEKLEKEKAAKAAKEAKATKTPKETAPVEEPAAEEKTPDEELLQKQEAEPIKEEPTKPEPTKTVKPEDKMARIRAKLKAVKGGAVGEANINKTIDYILENDKATDEDIKKFVKTLE